MRRFYRSFLTNTIAIGLIGATLVAAEQAAPQPETVQLVPCAGRVDPGQDGNVQQVETLRLQCYGGRGPWGLGMFAGPSSGAAWTVNSDFGEVRTPYLAEAKPMPKIERLAKKHKVPWPSEKAKRATDWSLHGVYVIHFRKNGNKAVWKYGITKNEDTRPKRQLRKCARKMNVDRCRYDWLRTGVKGWLNARQIEAGYAVKYTISHKGNCPPGMEQCL